MLKWADFHNILQTRAIEESDGESRYWTKENLRIATRDAGKHAGGIAPRFLKTRANLLESKLKDGISIPESPFPAIPAWLSSLGWALALVVGWFLAALGQEQEINLLALPLLGVLLWNAFVAVWSLVSGIGGASADHGFVGACLKRWQKPVAADSVAQRMIHLGQSVWMRQLAFKFRAWLHIGAALLAIGSGLGMYARGWSKEYRAVWESTLLDEKGAGTFFKVLFTPASKTLNMPVPVEDLPGMRRGIDHIAIRPAPALPWIHLYAATLGILIVLPRFLLVALELNRSSRVIDRELKNPDWQRYADRLLAQVDGAGAAVQILAHGMDMKEEAKDRWRQLSRAQWPERGACTFEAIPVGDEVSFAEKWSPPAGQRVLLVFNLASVPEMEVHRWLGVALQEKARAMKPPVSFAIAVDETAVRARWSGYGDFEERFQGRLSSWGKVLQDLPFSTDAS